MQPLKSDSVTRKFIDSIDVNEWEIESDSGWHDIISIHKTIEYEEWVIETESGRSLTCADTHILFDENFDEVFVKDLFIDALIQTESGIDSITRVDKTDRSSNMFDLEVDSSDHRFYAEGILSHNSTSLAAYVSWYVLFNSHKTAVILANKQAIATEIFSRVQFIIECLPSWLQQGITEWNKTSLVLENGSACFSAATSPSAIRGRSCVTGDTKVYVCEDGNVRYISIDQYLKESHKQNTKILTQDGFKLFDGFIHQGVKPTIKLITTTSNLKCTLDHRVLLENGEYIQADQLKIGDVLFPNQTIIALRKSGVQDVYDALNVHDTKSYDTNGIISHNCSLLALDEFAHLKSKLASEFIKSVFPTISSSDQSKMIIISTPNGLNHYNKIWVDANNGKNTFVPIDAHWTEHPDRDQKWADQQLQELGVVGFNQEVLCDFCSSSYTLVDGNKLSVIPTIMPFYQRENIELYKEPEIGHQYVITVDVSRGVHRDFSAFSIIDISQMPYEVVGIYKDNTISTLEFPHLIYSYAKQYKDAFILIEINDLGEEVTNTMWYDYEYENIYFSKPSNGGTSLSEMNGKPGVRTTSKVKTLGCAILKELVEKDQLILNAFRIVEELGIFVLNNRSYGTTDPVINDDLCSTLWLFAWLTAQPEFQELTNNNLRQALTESKQKYIDDQLTPFGFYVDGTEDHSPSSGFGVESTFELLNF